MWNCYQRYHILATASTETAPSCSATGINDDVWYTFTATATAHRFVYSNVSAGTIATALYTGTPGSLTQLTGACLTGATQDFTGLTVGTTYYARVYTTVATATTLANFTVCVGTPPGAPANDEPAGAISLTVNADLACAVTTNGTTFSATASTEVAPSCSATGINDDVWFTFTATATEHRFIYSNVTTGTIATALYTGTPGSLVEIENGCLSGASQNFGGLTVGTTYYARVYTTVATAGTQTNFTVCVGTPPAPPANDNCSGAIALTVNADLTCTAVTSSSTVNATTSMAGTPCNGSPDDDVWFSFVATSTAHNVTIQNIAAVEGTGTDMFFQVLSGACGQTTSIVCSDPNTTSLTGLTVGETYLIRVYSYSNTLRATFDICLSTPPPPPPPPANDECAAATMLTAGGTFATNPVDGTNVGATTSSTPAPTTCFGFSGGDIWYSVVVPASGSLTIETGAASTGGAHLDTVFTVYTGTCGSLTQIDCDDDGAATQSYSMKALTGLTPGSTIFIRVYEYSNDVQTAFAISAYDASLSTGSFDNANFSYYPNPVTDVLEFSYSKTVTEVAVFNLLGQQLLTSKVNAAQGQVNLSTLAAGTYILKVSSENGSTAIKVVKK